MYNSCAKLANNLCHQVGETCARVSTACLQASHKQNALWVNTRVFRSIVHKMYTVMSTPIFAYSDLLARYFSPLSTVPITRTTNLKKENN